MVLHPDAATARELMGLSYYRMGRFKLAIEHLEAHRVLSNSAIHLPVIADCFRALRRYGKVDELWAEIREKSPSAATVAEGRIVAAGALADRGKLRDALAVMEGAEAAQKRPKDHHVRMWYVIGDLYDRAGDAARAQRDVPAGTRNDSRIRRHRGAARCARSLIFLDAGCQRTQAYEHRLSPSGSGLAIAKSKFVVRRGTEKARRRAG